eukprot:scaffold7225_cov379-Prasinococcus_capsulatus_cf.AAC.10
MSRFFSRMRSKMSEHPSADSLDILEQQPPHQQLLQRLESFPTLSEPGDALQCVPLSRAAPLRPTLTARARCGAQVRSAPAGDGAGGLGLLEPKLSAQLDLRASHSFRRRPRGHGLVRGASTPQRRRRSAGRPGRAGVPPPRRPRSIVRGVPSERPHGRAAAAFEGAQGVLAAPRGVLLREQDNLRRDLLPVLRESQPYPEGGAGPGCRERRQRQANVQPSDVAIDERSGVLYVACYEKAYNALTAEGEVLNTLRTHAQKKGLVYRIPLATRIPQLFADRLSQVAGCNICYDDDALWVSELTNLVRIPLHPTDATPTSQWTRVAPFDPTLLAHNISIDQAGRRILFPYFRRVNVATSIVLQHSGIAWFLLGLFGMAYTFVMSKLEPIIMLQRLRFLFCGCLRRSRQEAEAEEAITSLTAKIEEGAQGVFTSVDGRGAFSVVCFGMYSYKTGSMQSLRVEHEHWQNGHCMHVEKAGRYLVFINYDKRELMVVEAEGALSP